jgi:hypothetical protein
VADFNFNVGFCVERLEEAAEGVSQDTRSLGRDTNSGYPEAQHLKKLLLTVISTVRARSSS